MNKKLSDFARSEIKKGLSELSREHWVMFNRMYSPKSENIPTHMVIDLLPDDKLDHALNQVEASLKLQKEEKSLWKDHKDLPEIGQMIIGKFISEKGEVSYFCGEFSTVGMGWLGIKTWHTEEDIGGGRPRRVYQTIHQWRPLDV